MSKIKIDVPDSVLGAEKEKELKSLRRRVFKLESENIKLKQEIDKNKNLCLHALAVKQYCADEFDLHSYDECEQGL